MSVGIAVNGQKLHEVRLPLESHTSGVVSCLSFPKSRIRFSLEGDTIRLAIPPLLGMELYRSGTLPQDTEEPVTIAISGRRIGQFTVSDVRYPSHGFGISDNITITLKRSI